MTKITHISEHKKYRPRFPDPKLPRSFLVAAETLGLPETGKPNAFYFRRRKGGTEVWIRFSNRFSLNASCAYGVNPKSFADARVWARDFALKHGFPFLEFKGKFIDLHRG